VSRSPDVDAVVVGAGFAGLYALHRLRGLGLSVTCLEAGDGIGGTWYWNRYPGARCDVESVDYSYSFSEELQQDWQWTERYASQAEILCYIEHVADRFDLRRDVRPNCRVVGAHYLEEAGLWSITLEDGESIHARYCVMATGALSAFNFPSLPGVSEFQGELLHSARWRDVPSGIAHRRVGIIGTGSSGIQLIPELAREAERLVVFQRTANFCMPARNRPLSPSVLAEVKAQYQQRRREARTSYLGVPMDVPHRSALDVSDDERRRAFESGWEEGGANAVLTKFYDLGVDEAANDLAAEFIRGKIREIVKDPATAEALLPRGYPIGAKRICVGSDYYETFNRDNVSLVDLGETPIRRFTPAGVETTATHYELDAIVFATGFDALTGALLAIDITGRRGVPLRDVWQEGPRTYLGLAVAGFPNMFCVCGPQSPSVASNMVLSIEQHVDWIADCIDWLDARGMAGIEPTVAAQDAWVEHVRQVADRTLRARGDSWYLGANIPGKPRVFMPYIAGVGVYRAKCDEVAANGYDGFELSSSAVTSELI
jgi:cyclohexanone monooxygenase